MNYCSLLVYSVNHRTWERPKTFFCLDDVYTVVTTSSLIVSIIKSFPSLLLYRQYYSTRDFSILLSSIPPYVLRRSVPSHSSVRVYVWQARYGTVHSWHRFYVLQQYSTSTVVVKGFVFMTNDPSSRSTRNTCTSTIIKLLTISIRYYQKRQAS